MRYNATMPSLMPGVCLLLSACGPVLLAGDNAGTSEDSRAASASRGPSAEHGNNAGVKHPVAVGSAEARARAQAIDDAALPQADAMGDAPELRLTVRSVDCGACFELAARAAGGLPPYTYEWGDGSHEGERRVCAAQGGTAVSVVATDATGTRSEVSVTRLEPASSAAGCARDEAERARVCLTNPSFEGTPALDAAGGFDAAPWSLCMAADQSDTVNAPFITNEMFDPPLGIAPSPTDGVTYLALLAGQQVSQELCEAIPAGSERALSIDLTRVVVPDVTDLTVAAYLEVWGGLASECSQQELLWVSPALPESWTEHCFTIRVAQYTDQITLRARAGAQGFGPHFVAVDRLGSVASCP